MWQLDHMLCCSYETNSCWIPGATCVAEHSAASVSIAAALQRCLDSNCCSHQGTASRSCSTEDQPKTAYILACSTCILAHCEGARAGNFWASKGTLPCAGHIQDVLKAAAGLPNLEILDLAGQAFSGTLPTQYPFPNLVDLNLMDNNIMVRSYSHKVHALLCRHLARTLWHGACRAVVLCDSCATHKG